MKHVSKGISFSINHQNGKKVLEGYCPNCAKKGTWKQRGTLIFCPHCHRTIKTGIKI
jgi:hypothetical protein